MDHSGLQEASGQGLVGFSDLESIKESLRSFLLAWVGVVLEVGVLWFHISPVGLGAGPWRAMRWGKKGREEGWKELGGLVRRWKSGITHASSNF